MKQLILTTVIALLAFSASAQAPDSLKSIRSSRVGGPKCPSGYFTLSTGHNNNTAIMGFNFELPVSNNIGIDAGVGTGQWNGVGYAGAKYYLQPCHRGFAFGVGVTYSQGTRGHTYRWETVNGRAEDNLYDKEPLVNVSASAYRYWSIGKHDRSRLYAQAGWSLALKSGDKFTQLSGAPITSRAAKEFNATAPGGLIIAVGISFGLH
jgi:hypothetical protein